jgi:hypothetical protein
VAVLVGVADGVAVKLGMTVPVALGVADGVTVAVAVGRTVWVTV